VATLNRDASSQAELARHFVMWDLPRVIAAYERAKLVLATSHAEAAVSGTAEPGAATPASSVASNSSSPVSGTRSPQSGHGSPLARVRGTASHRRSSVALFATTIRKSALVEDEAMVALHDDEDTPEAVAVAKPAPAPAPTPSPARPQVTGPPRSLNFGTVGSVQPSPRPTTLPRRSRAAALQAVRRRLKADVDHAVSTTFLKDMRMTRHQFCDVFTDYSVTTPDGSFLCLPMEIFELFRIDSASLRRQEGRDAASRDSDNDSFWGDSDSESGVGTAGRGQRYRGGRGSVGSGASGTGTYARHRIRASEKAPPSVDSREVFLLLALLCNGTHDSSIRFLFSIMDADESGTISQVRSQCPRLRKLGAGPAITMALACRTKCCCLCKR